MNQGYVIVERDANGDVVSYFDGEVLGAESGAARFYSNQGLARADAGQMQRYAATAHDVLAVKATQTITLVRESF